MTTSLPANPSLENLKKQAKTLLKAWQAGSAETVARIQAVHPHYVAHNPRLTDCQLVLAREAGFESWPQLKVAVQAANRERQHEFVELACLCYDDPHYDHRSFHVQAHEMLREEPWLSAADIWCAATAGNAAAVRSFLDKQPELVGDPGPHGWVPLICACYSRVKPLDPVHSTFDVAKLLLDCGANPNASTMKGNADSRLDQKQRRFTALAGLFGGGSTGHANQPPHPRWRDLAELLLSRGADPADQQALSINQDASLEMLLQHGLEPDDMTTEGITLMGRALSQAARHGDTDQVRLLLAHHVRTGENFQGKTPWEHAVRLGHLGVARLLKDAGAPIPKLSESGQFVSLCMAGDEHGAREMLRRAPDLLLRAPKDMVHRAVWTQRMEAVRLVLDLGFDPNHQEDNAAIMQAGVLAGNDEILKMLLSHGASLKLRDPWYDGTAIGWAHFFDFGGLRDRLLSERNICLFDVLDHDRLDRIPEILADDPAALERSFAECLSRQTKPEDWQKPIVRMVVRGKTEAVRLLIDHHADLSARHPDGRSLLQIARDHGFVEIEALLTGRTTLA